MNTSIQRKILFILITVTIAVSSSLFAQQEQKSSTEKYYWLNIGFGPASVGDDDGVFHTNISYQWNKNIITIRALSCGEMFGRSLNDYSLLYDRVICSNKILVSIGAGLGVVNGKISHGLFSTEENETIPTTIGLPFEAQIFWRPLKFLGIGLYGVANINSEETFYGLALGLQLGKLR